MSFVTYPDWLTLHKISPEIGPRQAGQRESPFFLCSVTHALQYSKWVQGIMIQSRECSKQIWHSWASRDCSSSFSNARIVSEDASASFNFLSNSSRNLWQSCSRCSMRVWRISQRLPWYILAISASRVFRVFITSLRPRFSSFSLVKHSCKFESCDRIELICDSWPAVSSSILHDENWPVIDWRDTVP